MPRIARQKHDNAVYHIMVRGNNREKIFFDDDDRIRFFKTLKRYQEKYQIIIYAYCLMDNHAHLLIDCNGQDISKVMQGMNLSYTQYINRKYGRCGHLFQGRFKSIIVKGDNDIIQESKYIHRNPVRAGIVTKVSEYEWSSFNIYAGKKDMFGIVDANFVLQYFSLEKSRAKALYIEYVDNDLENIISRIEEDVYESSDKKVVIEPIDINKILSKVAGYFNICIDDIVLKGNKRYAREKQIATYLISLKSKLPYKDIGQKFGICASAVGYNIKRAIEYIVLNNEEAKQFNMLFQ